MVKLDILFDKLRFEEKALYNTATKKGLDVRLVDSRNIIMDTDSLELNQLIMDLATIQSKPTKTIDRRHRI